MLKPCHAQDGSLPARKHLVAVTGAGGFVGRALVQSLAVDPSLTERAVLRNPVDNWIGDHIVAGPLETSVSLDAAFEGVEVVIHCAGRAHVQKDRTPEPAAAYRLSNVKATENVLAAARRTGVKRIVYLSSIKVNGETTSVDRPFHGDDPPCPLDDYARSKLEAEQVLRDPVHAAGLEIVILRPPLIYGPQVKGNMRRLATLVDHGLPIPLGAINNRRSLVGLDNLISAIKVVAVHPAAPGNTFLVSDQDDVSTPQLIRHMADAVGKRANLWQIPTSLLRILGTLTRRAPAVDRLLGSLRVDSEDISRLTGWRPTVPVGEGIRRMMASLRTAP